jgi:hypothetical protein
VTTSIAVAYAADLGLVHLFASLDGRVDSGHGVVGGMREIQIVHMRPEGPASVLICLADANNVTSDVVEFWESAEIEQAVRTLCVTNAEHDNFREPH